MSRVKTAEARRSLMGLRDYRMELWIAVAAGVARTANTLNRRLPGEVADVALAQFDKTFARGRK